MGAGVLGVLASHTHTARPLPLRSIVYIYTYINIYKYEYISHRYGPVLITKEVGEILYGLFLNVRDGVSEHSGGGAYRNVGVVT